MRTREEFYQLIDSIEDQKQLTAYFELIQQLKLNETGKLWDSLTDAEREEVMLSYEESLDPKNLISHDTVKKRHTGYSFINREL